MIEVLVAILILSLGILGLLGLRGQAIRFQSDAAYRAQAAALADQLVSQMWVDRDHLNSYLTEGKAVSALPDGVLKVEQLAAGCGDPKCNRLKVTVGWTLPGENSHRHVLVADINAN